MAEKIVTWRKSWRRGKAGNVVGAIEVFEEPGYTVEETRRLYAPPPMDDDFEDAMSFENERDVAEYLLVKIAKRVAGYRHAQSRAEKMNRG